MTTSPTRAGALLGRLVNAEPHEVRALLWSFAYFFFLLGGYYMLRPIRDQMAIARGLENLKWLFLYTFIVMLLVAPVYGALVKKALKTRIVPIVYRFFILSILLFWGFIFFGGDPAAAGTAFFVWLSVFNLFVVSVFWSLMNDFWGSEQGKRLFPFIAAGGSAGALAGPLIVALFAKAIGPIHLLLVAALFLEIALLCMRFVLRERGATAEGATASVSDDRPVGGSIFDGLGLILRSRYLAGVALYFLFMTGVATFLYYTQAHFIREATTDPAERTQIFALFDLLANALTLVLQVFVAGRLFQRFGIGWGLAALPLIVLAGFVLMSFGPTLVMLAAFQAVRRATQYAIARPARENLFTPLGLEAKYKAKNFIDTAVYRGGDAGSIWIFSWLRTLGLDFATMAGWMVVVAGLWFGTAVLLGRRHAQLAPGPSPRTATTGAE